MSKKHSMPEMKEGGVNVTPLIDVVMCLIIFFMLVAKIGVNKGGKKMDLPETIIGVKIDKLLGTMVLNVTDPNVTVNDDGTAVRNGSGKLGIMVTAVLDKDGTEKEIAIEEKGADGTVLRKPLETVLKAALARNKDFSVTIRAQKQVRFKDFQRVIAAAAQAGVTRINYAGAAKKV